MSKTMELEGLTYEVSYRNIKYPRLEFKTGKLKLILPLGYDHTTLLRKHKAWITQKSTFIKECLSASIDKELVKRSDSEFKESVYRLARTAASTLGVTINKIYFRTMRTKWASCSHRKNLTINSLMRYLPDYLIAYIIFHEIAHVIEPRHNANFWAIISTKFRNYKTLEKELFIYWFLVWDKISV